MVFVVCGLNHKTSPIAVREQFASSQRADWMQRLTCVDPANKFIILSTCNRTEIYCNTEHPERLLPWLANEFQYGPEELAPYVYLHQQQFAIHHLLRVASGLDSMMIGEPQILGQLKQAYQHACDDGTVDSTLRHIIQFVFSASKRIRTQSKIGENPISIAYAAVQLIGQQFSTFDDLNVFIIGSGETASLVAKYLQQQGAKRFMIANRTKENAKVLADRLHGQALSITEIPHLLPQADVVISATACPLPFINKHLVERALVDRNQAPMFLLDLSIPRDIEANVAELNAVRLYNIDDLQTIVDEGMEERRIAAAIAERLINAEIEQFIYRHRSRKANGAISDYRTLMKQLADQELQRATQQITSGKCQHRVLAEFSERLVNKLMHFPTIGLRQAASDERPELIDLVQYLFNQHVDLPLS
jgi:glutamyl-tRNA reductase